MNKLRATSNRVLAVLQAHPEGIRSDALAVESNTPREELRVCRLRKRGYQISTTYEKASRYAIYTLTGKTPVKPLPDLAFKVKVRGGRVTVHPYRPIGLSGKYGDFASNQVCRLLKKAVKVWLEDHTPYQTDTTPSTDPEPVQQSMLPNTPPVDSPVDNRETTETTETTKATDTIDIDLSFLDSLIESIGG